MNTPYATPASVTARIARLPDLQMAEIRALWKELFQSDTPIYNRHYLERRIAHKLQEIEFRKVDPNLLDRNKRRIEALIETGKNRKLDRDIRLMAGTQLAREYQGRTHRVTVMIDGQYEFQGRAYRSLSMIAREITGTRWSGPVFFGVKDYASKKSAAKKGGRK